jgi:hypothetical protein
MTEPASRRRWIAIGLGVVVAIVAFGFRFLAFRGLTNDHYMHLAWAQQVLLGEIPGRDFVEPGMPLAVALSAVAQWVWRSPVSEGILSAAMLAAAAGVTTVLVASLSRSLSAGVIAALIQVLLFPRLYSYPKILVPAVALWLLFRYAQRPSTPGLAALAAWTVAAFLFRHDLGLAAAVATVPGIVLAHLGDMRRAMKAAGAYILLGLVMVTPYLLFLQVTEGVAEHVRAAFEFGKSDSHQMIWNAPEFPFLTSSDRAWTSADALLVLFWAVHATLLLGTVMLVVKWRTFGAGAPVVAASLLMLLLYRLYVLRHPLAARMPDTAAVLAIATAWVVVELGRVAWARRRAWTSATLALSTGVALAAAIVVGTLTLHDVAEEVRWTNVAAGWRGVSQRAATVMEAGGQPFWPRFWPAGEVPEAVNYLGVCTAPTDRILLTWPAPEFYFFAGRGFAAGHVWFLVPRGFISDKDQDLMLHRLDAQSVPLALVNETRYDEFATSLPRIAGYIETTYEKIGTFTIRDGSEIAIRLHKNAKAVSQYGDQPWPCLAETRLTSHRVPPGASSGE